MSRIVQYFRRYSVLLGVVIFGVVISRVNFNEAAAMLRMLPVSSVCIAGAAYGVNVLIKAMRWHRMLRQLHIPIAARVSVSAFLSGALYGMITIGRLGELLRVEALLDKCPSRARALATCIADRVWDVLFLAVLALVGSTDALGGWWTVFGLLVTASGLTVLYWGAHQLRRRRDEQANVPPRQRTWLTRLRTGSSELTLVMSELLTSVHGLENLAWTAVGWCGYFAALAILIDGLGCDVPLFATVTVAAIAAISAALPISFQGVGTRDAAFALAFAPYGVSVTQSVTLSFALLTLFYVVTVPMGLIGVILRRRQTRDTP